LAVTVSNPIMSLWTVPITAQIVDESMAQRVPVPAAQAQGHDTRLTDCCTSPAKVARAVSGAGRMARRLNYGVPPAER